MTMETIWKYPIEIQDRQTIKMPRGAAILCCQVQKGVPCIWAFVDSAVKEMSERIIRIFGTGLPITRDRCEGWPWPFRYIGTFQTLNGDFVGHVFEEEK